MARACSLTNKKKQYGNLVSHSNIKTPRSFRPNVHNVSFQSEILGCSIQLKVSTNGLRTVYANGGLDNYLLTTSNDKLPKEAISIKNKIKKKISANKE